MQGKMRLEQGVEHTAQLAGWRMPVANWACFIGMSGQP
jgi:hypothetical protein